MDERLSLAASDLVAERGAWRASLGGERRM